MRRRIVTFLVVAGAGILLAAVAPALASAWTLTVDLKGNAHGKVTGPGNPDPIDCTWNGLPPATGVCEADFDASTAVGLLAAPEGPTTVVTWQGCPMVSGHECLIPARSTNLTVTATFASGNTLSVSKLGTGSGTIRSTSPAGAIDCGVTCSATLATSANVTLEALPFPGSVHVAWGGACANVNPNSPCTVSMSSARAVVATFDVTPGTFTLTVVRDGKGTVSGSGVSCPSVCSVSLASGTTASLEAEPDDGFELVRWEGCDVVLVDICTITVTGPTTVTAVFRDREVDAEVRGASASRRPDGSRVITAEIRTDELIRVELRLVRNGRVLGTKIVVSFRPSSRTVRLVVRGSVAGGPARVKIVLVDRAGNRDTFNQPVRVPTPA